MRRTERAMTLIELMVVIGIIAVLAGMLLPALAAARERARRAVCMNNLAEVGHALAMYAENYNEHFPCTPGWGHMELPGKTLSDTYGYTYTVTVGDQRMRLDTGARTITSPTLDVPSAQTLGWFVESFYGVIAHAPNNRPGGGGGARPLPPGSGAAAGPWGPGNLNGIPVGLGMVCTTGFLPNLLSLYCPSGPYDETAAHHIGVPSADLKLAASPTTIKYLGRKGSARLITGDWSAAPTTLGGAERLIACSYAYRNQPVMGPVTGTRLFADRYDANEWTTKLASGAPQRVWDNGCAITPTGFIGSPAYVAGAPPGGAVLLDWPWPSCFRKTVKLLDERALLADRWGKRNAGGAPGWDREPLAGDGERVHREGYNVLYGGGNARWIGDPAKEFMYRRHPNPPAGWSNASTCAASVLPGVTEWRLFDRAAGIDMAVSLFQVCDSPQLY